jgi:peptidyl-tRNA hydrolase
MALKQVFIINSDLEMGKGKIAVQTAHGEVFYMDHIICLKDFIDLDNHVHWRQDEDKLMKKVVLKAPESEMEKLYNLLQTKNIWSKKVFDRGLTQVKENSFTCLVIEPMSEELCSKFFSHLKLL